MTIRKLAGRCFFLKQFGKTESFDIPFKITGHWL